MVLEAFAAGCKGSVRISPAAVLEPGGAAFFGLVGIEHLLRLACAEGREWFYGDNSFFDVARGKFFRFGRCEMQLSRLAEPDRARFAALGLKVAPWRSAGSHIVMIEQSEHFMKLAGAHPLWLARVVAEIRRHTDRPLRIRRWNRDKTKAAGSLRANLQDAWALVTFASAAANEALLAGVPVFVGSKRCAAAPMAAGDLDQIENPRLPDGREDWAAGLAGRQWTLEEMRSGMAWRALTA